MVRNADEESFLNNVAYIIAILAVGYSVAGLVNTFFLAFEPPHWMPVGGIITVIRHATLLTGILYVFRASRE